MNHDEVKQHWTDWANSFGASVRATTRGQTAKELELDTLLREVAAIVGSEPNSTRLLEIGCGVGVNCIELAKNFPQLSITGIDYVAKMIENANSYRQDSGLADTNPTYRMGDVLNLSFPAGSFDIILSNRCLINLETEELQFQAIDQVTKSLRSRGHLILIENSRTTHGNQNQLRSKLGLPVRPEPEFNHFFEEKSLLEHALSCGLKLQESEDFASFHDLVLYVLVPYMNGGKVDYDHPAVAAATDIAKAMGGNQTLAAGAFGQNKLFHFVKQ